MSNKFLFSISVLLTFLWIGCSENEKQLSEVAIDPSGPRLFELQDGKTTGLDFENRVEDTEAFNILTYRNYYNGGGVAIGDVNGDGLADVYFTANMEKNKLYLNRGDWQFKDVSEQAGIGGQKGWSTGVTMADVNGDGWLDIYVCNSGDIAGDNKTNELYINNGKPTENGVPQFTESSKAYGLNDEGFSTHASFFDYDQDGDLDCYLLNNSFKNPEKIKTNVNTRNDKDNMGGDKLFRNDGKTFTDVTDQAGIYNSKIGFGLGVSVSDLNADGWPDIYISNDFWERDYLYINQGDGTFSEELNKRLSLCSVSSMGSDVADLNNDGTYEIFTTDMLAADNYRLKTMTMFDSYHLEDLKYRSSFHFQILQNTLQLNDGKANFQEVAHLAEVAATDWSWGALIFDFDNNGWKDIFVANGIYRDIMYLDFTNFINDQDEVKKVVQEKGTFDWRDFAKFIPSNPLKNYAFVNQMPASKASENYIPLFKNQAKELGLDKAGFSNGSAYGDLDNDGDLDLVVNNVNMPAFVYRNNAKKNYLKISLKGTKQNPFGIGAEVRIRVGERTQVLQNFTSRGFESSTEPKLLFGLGDATQVDQLTVTWPDQRIQELSNVKANQHLQLEQANATSKKEIATTKSQALFKDRTNQLLTGGSHKHQENRFSDFDYERLLPRQLSTEGPKIVKGDVNGDQLEDLLFLGAAADLDKLFIQQSNGTFKASLQTAFETDKEQESTCGAFFDADMDGDLDLLIGSGGNEIQKGIENFVLRYYENDGQGGYRKAVEKTPPAVGNLSVILPADVDGDGDEDLFIGGRSVPGNYGLPPRSFLFRNDGNGQWNNIITGDASTFGMITDGVWSDTDKDGDQDLILVGEWMPVMVFENGGQGMSGRTIIPNSMGWWTSIEASDLDNDGDEDFILGNWGLNTKFKASQQKPMSMFVKDFDQNKKSEFIINWFPPLSKQSVPFASKMDLTEQLPHLKKSILKYEDYASKTYQNLLNDQERKDAIRYMADYLESAILWNDGGSYRLEALPIPAQVAPVFGIVAEDLDEDGHKDIWLGGNFYGLKPEVGRHDSSRGVFLKGNGKGGFKYVPAQQTGMAIAGEVRDAVTFKRQGKTCILVARNDKEVKCFCQ